MGLRPTRSHVSTSAIAPDISRCGHGRDDTDLPKTMWLVSMWPTRCSRRQNESEAAFIAGNPNGRRILTDPDEPAMDSVQLMHNAPAEVDTCQKRRLLSARVRTREKAKRHRRKLENSFGRRWSTFGKANMALDPPNRRSPSVSRKPGAPASSSPLPKLARPLIGRANRPSGISSTRAPGETVNGRDRLAGIELALSCQAGKRRFEWLTAPGTRSKGLPTM